MLQFARPPVATSRMDEGIDLMLLLCGSVGHPPALPRFAHAARGRPRSPCHAALTVPFGRDWMLGLGVLSYLSPGLLAVGPVRFGSSPPAWFTELTLRAQDLHQLGALVPDAAADRDRPDYSDYANGEMLRAAPSTAPPLHPEPRLCAWVLFAESCILGEYLVETYPIQHGLFLNLRDRDPELQCLPAAASKTELRRQQREEYNHLRRDTAARCRLLEPRSHGYDHLLHRREWVGECVGGVYDFHQHGYNLEAFFRVVSLLTRP